MRTAISSFMKMGVVIAIAICGVGCGKAGEKTQVQLANNFANDVNNGSGDNLDVVKAVTTQQGYAVFMDTKTQRYFSVYISDYNGGGNNYLTNETQRGDAYFNLRSNHDGTYTSINSDGSDGLTFSKGGEISGEKDLRKVQASFQEAKVQDVSSKLMARIGFSNSDDAIRAARQLVAYSDTMSKREMTQTDVDALTTGITGTSASDAIAAYKSGDQDKINAMLAKANEKGLGSTPDEAKEIVTKFLSNF